MMAALSRRDIEMIFRADTDKATRPIADLGKAVKTARGQLEDLVSAASTSEDALDKLGDTTRELKKAQDELGSARSLLTSFNAQNAAIEKAEAKVAAASAKFLELKERVEGAEKPTKVLVTSMNNAERALNAAQESLDRVSAEAKETKEQIESIIGPVASVDAGFREIANTSKEIARGLALAGDEADNFRKRIAAAASANSDVDKKLNADVAFEQQGRSAGLLQAQIDYISQFENRVELLNQAKRELTSQNAAFDQALQAQDAKVGAANVSELRRSIQETFAEDERAKQISAFKQIATDANAAVTDVSRFAVAEDAAAASGQRFSDSIRDILSPANAAKASIDGVEAAVAEAAGVLEGKGRKTLTEYNMAMNELLASGASIGGIAKQIDAFRDQQAALAATGAKYRELVADAESAALAIRLSDAPTQEMVNDLKRLEAQVTTAGNAMKTEGEKAEVMGAKLRRAGVDTNDLAGAEKRLADVAKDAADTQKAIGDKSGGKAGGLFGLSVQDATNLSYQFNDIFTQLASGQSIFITLAQQGPQIWQIEGVKGFIAALGPLIPVLLAVGAGLAVVAMGVKRVADESAELKNANAYVASLGEAGSLTAQQIADASIKMQDLGVKAEDARASLKDFNEGGLDPQYLNSFIEAASNASKVTGGDFKDAFGALTEAMNGGWEEVEKLNEAFPILSDAERVHIKAMYDSGQESEARRIVFERFFDQMDKGAAQLNGPFTNAVKFAKENFIIFLDNIGRSDSWSRFFVNMDEAKNVITGFNYLLLRARGLSAEVAGKGAVTGQLPGTGRPQGGRGPAAGRATGTTPEGQAAIKEAREEQDLAKGTNKVLRDRARLTKAARDARAGAPKEATTAEKDELAALAVAKERTSINAENAKIGAAAAKKSQAARDKAAREAETLANKIKGQADSLESALDAMGAKVAKVSAGTITQQLDAARVAIDKQYDSTLRKVQDFSKLTGGKGEIGGMSIKAYTDQINSNKTILTQQAQLKVYEDNVNDVLNTRKALLADIEDKANRGEYSSAEAIARSAEVTSTYAPIIQSLVQAATAFATTIGGAKPSAEIDAFVAKLNTIGSRTSGDNQEDVQALARKRIGTEEANLNKIISERNNLVESYNTLQELGLMSATTAREKSAAAYNASRADIAKQSEVLRKTVAEASEYGAVSTQVYDTMIAKLKAVDAQAAYLDPRFAQLKSGIDNIVSQNATDAIVNIIDNFAKAAAGAQSWGDALKGAGMAVVSFIADTLIQIGKLILQMLVLAAVQSATGIPVAALLGASGGGGGAGGGFKLFGLKLFHGGGEVGNALTGQQKRSGFSVSPATLAAAPRYHDGTPGVGLKGNEQIAVLEKGEKVLTEEQQRREAASKKGAGGNGRGLRQVLAFGDDQVAAAMSGQAGEDVTITHLRRNAPLLKQLVDQG
jgi:hypothetical protein